jgi:hypothetical protein
VLFTWLMFVPFIPDQEGGLEKETAWFIIPVSLCMIAMSAIALRDALFGKVVIDHESISISGTVINRQLFLNEIKGYRVDDKYIYVEPAVTGKKRVKISTLTGGAAEIEQWLAKHVPDLDREQASDEKHNILSDENFGSSEEQRAEKLEQARKVCKVLNIAGGSVLAWNILYPAPYSIAILAAMIVPLIALVVLKLYRGLVGLDDGKNSARPSLLVAIGGGGMGLMFRTVFDYHFLDPGRLWIMVTGVAVLLTFVLIAGNKVIRIGTVKSFFAVLGMLLVFACYAFGAVMALNAMLDRSLPAVFRSTVLAKSVTSGKTTSYNLMLAPWGPVTQAEEEEVTEELYQSVEEGDEVDLYLLKGAFGIRWYDIRNRRNGG